MNLHHTNGGSVMLQRDLVEAKVTLINSTTLVRERTGRFRVYALQRYIINILFIIHKQSEKLKRTTRTSQQCRSME